MSKMTEPRRDWLLYLRDIGPDRCRTTVGFHCRKLGWTSFVLVRDGKECTAQVLKLRYGTFKEQWDAGWRYADGKEAITDEGLDALEAIGL